MSNWRRNIKSSFTETVPCDTLLPVDTVNNRGPLSFNVRPAPQHVVDVRNMQLAVKFSVQKKTADGWGNIEANDKITLVNNFGFSLFEDVQLTINGTLAETSQREYARISYLKNLLFATNLKKLESALYYEDDPRHLNRVLLNEGENRGEYTRSLIIKLGAKVSFLAPIYLDILQADTYFPETVAFNLRFFPARSMFCLFQGLQPGTEPIELKVNIHEAELLVPRLQMNSSIKSVTANYEAAKTLTFISPKEVSLFSRTLNVSPVPKKIAIAIISEKQLNGTYKINPLYFQHEKVKNVTVRCNGQVFPTLGGLKSDFENQDWLEPYNALFTQLGAQSVPFTRQTFENGFTIFGVSLGEKPPKFGTVDVDISFAEAPTENLAILMFCFYDSKLQIDSKGVVHSDANPKV